MKRKIAYFCFATCLLTAGIFAALGNPVSAKAEEQDSTQEEASSETGDSAQLKTLLEGSGFTVQGAYLIHLSLIGGGEHILANAVQDRNVVRQIRFRRKTYELLWK